jgi:pimeloyl-ACP methyl ester carboxylesterase
MPERRHLEIDGLHLAYLEKGSAAQGAPSLVLLHGLMGSAATFLPLMESLDGGQHVIALDLPGAGLSERRSDIAADLKSTAKLVLRVLDSLGLDKPVLLGHSHGGAIALRLAAKHPDRLTSLALLAPAHPYFDEGDPLIRFYLSLPGRLFAYTMPWFPQWAQLIGLRRMAGPQSWDTPERLKPYRENLRVPGTISHLLNLLTTWNADMSRLRRLLRKPLTVPSLVLWGNCDRAVPAHTANELRAHLLHSELHILPGVGHRPAEEAPNVVADLLHRLLDSGVTPNPAQSACRPNSSATQDRIAALMTSSFESGD